MSNVQFWLKAHHTVVSIRLYFKNTGNHFIECLSFSIKSLTCLGATWHIKVLFISFTSLTVAAFLFLTQFLDKVLFVWPSQSCTALWASPSLPESQYSASTRMTCVTVKKLSLRSCGDRERAVVSMEKSWRPEGFGTCRGGCRASRLYNFKDWIT